MGYITLSEKHGKKITVTWEGKGHLEHGKGIGKSVSPDGRFAVLDLNLTDDFKNDESSPVKMPKQTPPPDPDGTGQVEQSSTGTNTDSGTQEVTAEVEPTATETSGEQQIPA